MENNSILDHDLSDEMELSPSMKITLEKNFRLGKILSFVLFIFSGILAITFFVMTVESTNSFNRNRVSSENLMAIILFLFLIMSSFISAFHLLSYSNRGMTSLRTNNNKIFAISIESLKGFFRSFGIFLLMFILILVLAFLLILFSSL